MLKKVVYWDQSIIPKYVRDFVPDIIIENLAEYIYVLPILVAMAVQFLLLIAIFSKLQNSENSRSSRNKIFFTIALLQIVANIYICKKLVSYEIMTGNSPSRIKDTIFIFIGLFILSSMSTYSLYKKEKLETIVNYFYYSLALMTVLFIFFLTDVKLSVGGVMIKFVYDATGITLSNYKNTHFNNGSKVEDGTPLTNNTATVPGTVPATVPGTVPVTVPATVPVTVPATVPATVPVTVPATVPATVPVTVQNIQTEAEQTGQYTPQALYPQLRST